MKKNKIDTKIKVKKQIKKYETKLIDEVAFLKLCGLEYKTIRLENKNAIWIFERTKKLNKTIEMFWTDDPKVSLTRWLMVRQQIKFEQTATEIIGNAEQKTKQQVSFPIKYGDLYYYINEHKTICRRPLGRNPVHVKCLEDDNFFITEEEAKKHLLKTS